MENKENKKVTTFSQWIKETTGQEWEDLYKEMTTKLEGGVEETQALVEEYEKNYVFLGDKSEKVC
jgi:hypothetical protein